jgi:hypothetical protein
LVALIPTQQKIRKEVFCLKAVVLELKFTMLARQALPLEQLHQLLKEVLKLKFKKMLDSKLEEEIKNSSKGDCNSYFISCMI